MPATNSREVWDLVYHLLLPIDRGWRGVFAMIFDGAGEYLLIIGYKVQLTSFRTLQKRL